ncbi:carboxypeptidase-like protein [Lutibacter oceani]|uniref:Carboxypeptidase-like protein n=1 Tax=Lutibacter oceani TaxID=1853311 RepID=A0A3D9RTM8_9FLAO|nr:DUF5686 and carboxypeptidase-like regulatory domain-containing protein [Lutibacter oceani]REE83217.1 carboxypeptidase-like protein [Lutibacter oceani]
MKKFLFLIYLIPLITFSQKQIQGIVVDSKTKNALPFASIITNTGFGTLTDVDGKFSIQTKNAFNQIKISYIGYKSVTVPINLKDKFISVKLTTSVESLNEVLITAKENPALQIIRNTIKNKVRNDIEKSLNSFKFNTYNKILVTANPDSINGKIDSIFIIKKDGQKEFSKLDSSNFKFKKDIVKQHIYISEKVSEYKFQKGKKKKEVVLASRMAGLKQPIYELLALTFQDLSFYNEFYTLAGTKYTNPIANNALKQYNYKILDTINNGIGESIIIYFKPKEKKEILGIEGVLYIDTKQFAITKAIAELKGIVNVKATQNYTFKKDYKIWFPSDMNIVLRKGDNDENIALFGGTVKFSQSQKNDSIINTKGKNESDVTYFISKSVNSNISINKPVIVKSAASTIQFNDDAHKKSEEFWNSFRTDSITKRGETTYVFLDSVAEKEGVEKKINLARNILKGYYPTKYINLDLGKILNLNNYEGLRLGFGGETNSNFSNTFKIESYVAYGTKDKDFKYSFGVSTRLNKDTNTWFGVNFTNELKEAASLDFIKENNSFSPINPRNLNIDKFYNYKTVNAFLIHDIQPNLETKFQLSSGDYLPVFNYHYISSNKNLINYKLTTATLGLQYNPKNEYMNSPVGKLKIKNEFPQFTFQLTKSFEDVFNGDFDFTQLNLRVLHKINRIRKAKTTIMAEGGIVFGEAPISHLYNSTPNYTFKSPWVKRITFAGKNSFETMGYNEFISDKFAAIHVKHELTPFKISSKFKPQLSLITRAAIGDIENPQYHTGLLFKSLNKGYLESGLELNSLFKGFGVSSFYRYGDYKNNEWSDNLAVKLTYKLRLGF